MEMKPYIVYVKVNSSGYIVAVNSSAFLSDLTDWVEIDSGYGDKYHHAQGNYFRKPIVTETGAYCYKLIDGKTVECTPVEIAEQKTGSGTLTHEERISDLEEALEMLLSGVTE